MGAGDFEGDIDTVYRLANDIVCGRAFRFGLASDVAIEMLPADEIGIRYFLFRILGVADHAVSYCEPFYRHPQTRRSQRSQRRLGFRSGLAQLAAATLNRLAAKCRRLVNGIGSVALDPFNFFERKIELLGNDLAQRG